MVGDEERLKRGHGFRSVFCVFWYFDDRKEIRRIKNRPCDIFPKDLFRNTWRTKAKWELANPVSLGK